SRSVSAEPVCSCAFLFLPLAHETAGAARTRLSLRPLSFKGCKSSQGSGAARRENANACPCRCLISELNSPRTRPEQARRKPDALRRCSLDRRKWMTRSSELTPMAMGPRFRGDDGRDHCLERSVMTPLLQRDRQAAQIEIGHQPDLLAGQFQ